MGVREALGDKQDKALFKAARDGAVDEVPEKNGHVSVVAMLDKMHGAIAELFTALVKSDEATVLRLLVENVPAYITYWKGRFEDALQIAFAETGNFVFTQGKCTNAKTALHFAATNGHASVVTLLLAHRATVNALDKDDATPLFMAARGGHVNVVELLLAAKADPTLANSDDETPRSVAEAGGHTAVVAALDKILPPPLTPAKPTMTDIISQAVFNNDATRVTELLRAGADPNARYERGPALSPTSSAKAGVGISFLKANAKAHIQDDSSLLHVAAAHGSEAIVALLLASSAIELNPRDSTGATPMYVAAANGHASVVQQLVTAKADVRAVTNTKDTSLHVAVVHEHPRVVERLLDAGADVDVQNNEHKTPWQLAQELTHPAILEVFRTKKAANDLLRAIETGNVQQLQMLLGANANPNAIKSDTGDSLLHLAAKISHLGILDILLQAPHINLQMRNKNMETALLVVIKQRDLHKTQMLHNAMRVMPHFVPADTMAIDRHIALGESKGNMVYQGTFAGSTVAIKTALFPSHAQSLVHEIQALLRCDSPYLMRLLAVADQDTPAPKLVFEVMDVGNLRMYLDKKREHLSLEVDYSLLDVAWVVANGLADLHRQGLRHRDLKSSNILLSTTNYIKVGGLGLAFTASTAPSSPTRNGGMPFWTAPEILRKGQIYSDKADIYSFGIILIELETLQLPYATQDIDDCTFRGDVRDGKLQPSLSTTCAPWLRDLVSRCIAYNPSQRPSAQEIVDQLQSRAKD
ncbi:TKL protein kinase [Saprolegnia parasitica CBS 223.65]|uniref:TKL protein kinase n=1 Tax=Saprolegnia parasitica (strain CBS 223.65) TaxID=695850 RepID=A0A067CPE6_SAPPC|nr:TKL protein kinase [Saprolegnia parasitica CBS 223.65]KDO31110.1 TKL protein kinase [Saprolegnia parasitica CBS 223.65]|eukprot:XP_012198239.1 TKL protein kinase [Saprolegnia parasitica CBS 223.65]